MNQVNITTTDAAMKAYLTALGLTNLTKNKPLSSKNRRPIFNAPDGEAAAEKLTEVLTQAPYNAPHFKFVEDGCLVHKFVMRRQGTIKVVINPNMPHSAAPVLVTPSLQLS